VGFYKVAFLALILLFLKPKKTESTTLKTLLILSFLFSVNQFLISPIFNENLKFNFLRGSIYYAYRFLYVFIFILVFSTLKDYKKITLKVLKFIEYLLFFNAFLILMGFLWDINLLASYPNSSRYGSDGLFNKVNESTYLYIIYIASLYFNYLNYKKGLAKLIFIILISFLIGTKTIILFLVLLFMAHVFFAANTNKFLKFLMGLITIIGIFFFNKIAEIYFKLIPFWNKVLENHDVTTLLFSKRDYLLKDNIEYINSNWGVLNFLIGGPYYSENFKITQMDGPDLFLFFGVIGFLLYLFLFFKHYFISNNLVYNLITLSILVCGLLSGGLFLSVMAMIYLYMLKVCLEKSSRHL